MSRLSKNYYFCSHPGKAISGKLKNKLSGLCQTERAFNGGFSQSMTQHWKISRKRRLPGVSAPRGEMKLVIESGRGPKHQIYQANGGPYFPGTLAAANLSSSVASLTHTHQAALA